ncbi:MAG TPA: hypothetical protein VN738_07865 [Acidothermaceae bacterium]|nr:hypothetical protein [Acidothermaceae bacterium]
MSTIVEDVRGAAVSIADIANDAGYSFDFSARSLWDVERFLDDNASGGEPKAGGLLSKDLGSRVFALGAYVGEVIREAVGGEWVSDDSADDDSTVTLRTGAGELLWPNQQVMKRIMTSDSQSVLDYARAVGVDPGL